MPIFSSAHAAFAYAWEILEGWRAGKTNYPTRERIEYGRNPGTRHPGVRNAVTAAHSIMVIASRHDICDDGSSSWFVDAFISRPDPVVFIGSRRRRLD